MVKYETIDQISVAKKIKELPYIDSQRSGIWGWSFGGHMATNCLLKGNDTFSIVHQTGIEDRKSVENSYATLKKKHPFLEFETFEFITNLEDFYSSTRVLVSRAGASTISESLRFPFFSILIPIKDSTNNHQHLNAVELSNKNLAEIH